MCVSYRTEKDKAPPSPLLTIHSNGLVSIQNDQVLVSTCRMHVYKFPFDIQSCNLTFKSVVHSGELIRRNWLFSSREQMPPGTGPPLFIETSQFFFFSPPSVDEIQLVHNVHSSEDTHTMMRTQYEWLFINMTVTNKTVNMFGLKQDVLIYTVSDTGYRTGFEAGMVATFFLLLYIRWSCKYKQRKNSSN